MIQEVEKMTAEVESSRNDREVLEKDKNALEAKIEPLKTDFQELSEQRDEIDDEIQKKQQQLSAILSESAKINTKKLDIKYQTKIVDIPTGEHDILGREKTKKKKERTGNLIIPERNFKVLEKALNKALTVQLQIENFSKTDLVQENRKLKKNYAELRENHNQYVDDYNDLLEEKQELEIEVRSLRDELKHVYNGVKEFFRENAKNLNQARSLLGDVVEKVKEKIQGSTFERAFRQEVRRENERDGFSR